MHSDLLFFFISSTQAWEVWKDEKASAGNGSSYFNWLIFLSGCKTKYACMQSTTNLKCMLVETKLVCMRKMSLWSYLKGCRVRVMSWVQISSWTCFFFHDRVLVAGSYNARTCILCKLCFICGNALKLKTKILNDMVSLRWISQQKLLLSVFIQV